MHGGRPFLRRPSHWGGSLPGSILRVWEKPSNFGKLPIARVQSVCSHVAPSFVFRSRPQSGHQERCGHYFRCALLTRVAAAAPRDLGVQTRRRHHRGTFHRISSLKVHALAAESFGEGGFWEIVQSPVVVFRETSRGHPKMCENNEKIESGGCLPAVRGKFPGNFPRTPSGVAGRCLRWYSGGIWMTGRGEFVAGSTES